MKTLRPATCTVITLPDTLTITTESPAVGDRAIWRVQGEAAYVAGPVKGRRRLALGQPIAVIFDLSSDQRPATTVLDRVCGAAYDLPATLWAELVRTCQSDRDRLDEPPLKTKGELLDYIKTIPLRLSVMFWDGAPVVVGVV